MRTDDFIALVEELAGQMPGIDLAAFFDTWLYGDETPPLPATEPQG